MSGLRETIRRRGGLTLTSRVVGGLWVVGQRTQTSPYNAAATEALKAQFPTQWNEIRQYAYDHPEHVDAINTYAPEDAYIMLPLIPQIGQIRRIKGNGNYVTLGQYDYANISYDIKAWLYNMQEFDTQLIGGDSWSYSAWITQIMSGGICNTMCDGSTRYTMTSNDISMLQENNVVTIQGRVKNRNASFSGTKNVYIFGAGNGHKTGAGVEIVKIQSALSFTSEADVFVPLKRTNGDIELLNLRTGTFATRSGVLAIEEPFTPAS